MAIDGVAIAAVDDLETAVRAADLVCAATMSKRPLIKGAWLKPGTHVDLVGSFTADMREALEIMGSKKIDPVAMITHVGGLNSAAETTLNLPSIPGGKKLIYTNKNLPMVAIEQFEALGKDNPFYRDLAEICARNNNLWSLEAEKYLIKNAPDIN